MTDIAPSHLDLDALADALAGEGDAAGAAHLASCPSCTSRLGELRSAEARVVAALAALPDPPVPADLAERLTTALAAEPPLTPARAGVTALPSPAPRRRFLPAAAAAVLLLSGAGLGYAVVTGAGAGGDNADTAAGGAGETAAAALVLNASGTDYANTQAVGTALPGVLAGTAGPVALDMAAEDGAAGSAAGSAGGTVADAQPQQSAPAGQRPSAIAAPVPDVAAAPDPLARLRTSAGLEDCLAAVLPPEEPGLRPRALDYARYAGRPALAVLLPDPDPAKLSVYVVGPDCSRADARLLGFFRVDAP